eukprot:7542485-Karenia_brevis.AAC.1
MLEKAWPKTARRCDFPRACRESKDLAERWIAFDRFENIVTYPNDNHMPPKFLGGPGDPRYADTMTAGGRNRFRHLTFESFQRYHQSRPAWFHEETIQQVHATVLPVYGFQGISVREMELYFKMIMTWSEDL